MTIADKAELNDLVRELVKEAIKDELLKLTLSLTPYVSNEEMKELNNIDDDSA